MNKKIIFAKNTDMGKYIRFDWAMKKLLRDKANFAVLEGLISTLLDRSIHIDQLLESESNQDDEDDKQNRVDILALDDQGTKYIIEVQNESEFAYFQRILFGTSKLVTQYMRRGGKYHDIHKIYSINIVYFPLGTGTDTVYRGTTEFRGIHNNELLTLSPFQRQKFDTDVVSDLFPEFFILRVNEFNDVATTPLEEWLDFLKNEHIPEQPKAPGLAEASEIMRYEHMSPEEKRRYEAHINNAVILQDNIETARGEGWLEGQAEGREQGLAEGLAEGRAEGAKEKARQVAEYLKKLGIKPTDISDATGLSIDEIETL